MKIKRTYHIHKYWEKSAHGRPQGGWVYEARVDMERPEHFLWWHWTSKSWQVLGTYWTLEGARQAIRDYHQALPPENVADSWETVDLEAGRVELKTA
jgi:hypothetical protein